MLNDAEFQQWSAELRLSEAARCAVAAIRAAPPARRVRSAAGNVSGVYPSAKMGWGAQFESHRVELPGLIAMEYGPDVLEFYDQPPSFVLRYQGDDGKRRGHRHTADYFVIAKDGAWWEEWKTEEELERLALRQPQRYCRDGAGRWHCPPGEDYAGQYGLGYRVRSSADIDWIWTRNMLFLEDYLRADGPPVAAATVERLTALVAGAPGLTLEALLRDAGAAGGDADAVYRLIVTGRLWVDLRQVPLATPTRVRVYRDEALGRAYAVVDATAVPLTVPRAAPLTVAPGATVAWDGRRWTVANAGATATALLAEDGRVLELPNDALATLAAAGRLTGLEPAPAATADAAIRERLLAASPADLAAALRRHELLATGDADRPARTRRKWRARQRAAEAANGCGFLGLLDGRARKGNRLPRLTGPVRPLIAEAVAAYETRKQQTKAAAYGELLRLCAAAGVDAPGYKAFARALARRPRHAQVAARQGPRAAYRHEPWHWELTLTTPRHGDRPWEIAHLDHTQLDVELVCSTTGRRLGRPWATFLTDAHARRLLAVALAFDPPSYRSCLLAVRECVGRHGRLPQTLVVDGGKEFASIYFETLLAACAVTKKTRPGGKPRFGAVCERLFGTANDQFIHRLAGNTQSTVDVRQVTAANDPKGQACWTFAALHARLNEWAYEVYDTLPHPALGQSPRAAFAAGLARGGHRPERLIAADEAFRLLTLPTTPKGTARVQPNHGVKIRYLYYWHEAFRQPEVERSQVPVRYDPFDAGTAYAFVGGRWVACRSEHYLAFQGHTERELQLASVELRRRQQGHARHFAPTARRLAEFLASLEGQEAVLTQRLRDLEARQGGARTPGGAADGRPDAPLAETVAAPAVAARDPRVALADLADYEEYR